MGSLVTRGRHVRDRIERIARKLHAVATERLLAPQRGARSLSMEAHIANSRSGRNR
ncbi:hypothetical protein [Halobaculum sp. D14]|uniref:hypothetical protein n=1 Tax=unclassified Halobaculum TaxID=2640896 RepID=UPI003EBC5AE7